MRTAFVETATALLDEDPRTAVVLVDISADAFRPAARAHPDRVLNVGIREQLMVSVAGGLALTGLRPIVHSYATFLIDRAYEQIKLDLDYQGVGAVLVSIGASYDAAEAGRTHQSPGDVALIDTLGPHWTVHVPGHRAEVPALLRAAATQAGPVYIRLSTQTNAAPGGDGSSLAVVRRGERATVVAVGPMLDPVLAATSGLDVTVAYTHTPRPLDGAGFRALVGRSVPGTDVVVVEPYLAGTSAAQVTQALVDVPHRLLSLGTGKADLRRYGTPADHQRWHGLDAGGLHARIAAFLS